MNEHTGTRVREILATVKPLAVEYYRLTGKPLGVTGEVERYVAAETLGLTLVPARTAGYDALRLSEQIQIKGRVYGKDVPPTSRKASRSRRSDCVSKIIGLVPGLVEDSVVRSDSQGFGVAGSSSKCAVASIVW